MALGPHEESAALIRLIARGDRDAFRRFYDRYAPLVFTCAVRILRARPDAEDLLQEVFLQVWHQAGQYEGGRGSPEAWLITITRSRALNRIRDIRRRDRGVIPLEGLFEAGRVESDAGASEAKIDVRGALTRLSGVQREALELAYFDGLTQSEIAERLGEPLGTIKTRMRDALERLRKVMGLT